jgi:bifunctional non-homologous end joining protein LigD
VARIGGHFESAAANLVTIAAVTSGGDRLDAYRHKRDFDHTPEPSGSAGSADSDGDPRFVVQRHRARRLHYDVRLEVDGVLVSWSVPRGPTLDPGVRRLAVHVEDHPVDYVDFEGVIPKGEYGAGDVIVWDTGTYRLTRGDDAARELAEGELHVEFHGQKLRGRVALVRTGRRTGEGQQWLMIHADDEHAVADWDAEDHPRSVLSGRTNEQVRHPPAPPPPAPDPHLRWHAPSASQMEALDALGNGGVWHVDGVDLSLSNLDKVLFPAGGESRPALTKRDLVRHYAAIAPLLLAYLADRPVNLQRFPNGVGTDGFWQKDVPSSAPEWLTRWHHRDARPGRTEWYSVLDRPAALVFMANLGVVELHPWTSTAEHPERPSWALIDIDPGTSTTFDDVVVLARLFRTALDHLGMQGGPKVTGQRGLQIWVPVSQRYSFAETRSWVEQLSRAVGSLVPELVSWNWRTDERDGLARLDFTQNAPHKTLVAPWSVRPAPGGPVSVPIEWDELEDPALCGDRWSIPDVAERVRHAGDPLARLVGLPQELPPL